MTTTPLADDLFSSFEAALTKLRFELSKNINAIDVLDQEELEKCIHLFNDRITIFQHDFLKFLHSNKFSSAEKFDLEIPDDKRLASILTGIGTAGLAGLLLGLIPVATTGFWIWTSTVTCATLLGGLLGMPAGPAAAIAGGAIGCVAGFGVAVVSRPKRRKSIRKGILKYYDEKAVPKLKEWARKQIASVVKSTDGSQNDPLQLR